MDDDLQAASRRLEVLEVEQRLTEGFQDMDAVVLAELSDRQLAMLQSKVERHTPQFIRAEQEWQRRLIERQLRTARFAAWVGVAGTVIGVIIGWILSKI